MRRSILLFRLPSIHILSGSMFVAAGWNAKVVMTRASFFIESAPQMARIHLAHRRAVPHG
jgi:hypothetical protein